MHTTINYLRKLQNKLNQEKINNVLNHSILGIIKIKSVTRHYFRCYHVHLRLKKNKQNVSKKEYLDEVMASTK